MPMNSRDKAKILLVLLIIMIPAAALTPFGVRWTHAKGVEGSPFWMKVSITSLRITLSSEQAAEYMRQFYLLWPDNSSSNDMIIEAAGIYYNLGRTAEKGPQYRLLTRAWDIMSRMKTADWAGLTVTIDEEEKVLPLRLDPETKAKISERLDWMRTWHNKSISHMQDELWDYGLEQQWKFPDAWDRRKVR